jgi:hypothetical protein
MKPHGGLGLVKKLGEFSHVILSTTMDHIQKSGGNSSLRSE